MTQPWLQGCNPHRDLREGKFDESVFAADLSDVVANRGPLEYRDPVLFFRKTYPTQGLQRLLGAVLSRLAGRGGGEAVIQIQTPFGGGKTHSLIALYHLFRHPQEAQDSELGREALRAAGVAEIPAARVVTFVGTAADPLRGRTPWGELAAQLGRYELLAEHDQQRRAPGKDRLHQVIGEAPTLILMDEIAEYAVKARDFLDQVVAFFQELTETVRVLERSALVATLPSSAPYGEEGERVLHQLQQIFGRMEAIYTPVDGEEIYEVIRRRLFEEIRPDEARRTADAYWEMYQRLGEDIPREAREPAYRDRLRRAYPFHPELIDLLMERWSTFPTFQRTRGVLRLLAEIVADRYRNNDTASLILPGHIDLSQPAIRREFLKHIGNEFEGVIASDIAGPGARAPRIDQEMGSEYARFRVASALATAIFFGSFSGGERRGVSLPRLRLMALQEGLPPAVLSDALQRMEEALWYLHEERGIYEFRSQPNLNRVIVEKEEAVRPEEVEEEIRRGLERLAGRELRVFLWPCSSADVPDTRELKLAVLGLDQPRAGGRAPALAEELLRRSGTAFRAYANTLLILAVDERELTVLRQHVKRLLAFRAIEGDRALMSQLSEENRKKIQERCKELEDDLPFRLLSTYRHLAKAGADGVEWQDIGLPTSGDRGSLARRVVEFMKSSELLAERIAPGVLLRKAMREGESERPVREIVEAFWRYPNLPMLADKAIVHRAIVEGVQSGVFAVRSRGRVYFREPIPEAALEDEEAVLLREAPPPQPEGPALTAESAVTSYPAGVEAAARPMPEKPLEAVEAPPAPSKGRGLSEVYLRARVPWDRTSEIIRGVISPLRTDGAELEIEFVIRARSAASIRPETLEHKVLETLRQIGAEILDQQAR
ncbi:MAG: DUF499 domain-containing protein [Thermoflexus sp.]|uniref:ATP-binding protein n=1 Tax=Thermoflexus sp. TaxID=1969742 RepID=UPI0025F6E2B9|nr:DUF499 domain-containing protein [Thermoflexus sp.]MCS6963061.1 DUF499 domain-containing protein [Thermoflexus sp.]MDW8064100.1 DUF499 domain-containing protein [Anaerolineae bacterium]MDW8186236.1 DUF499 domain-containing protein [Anaerolineae bacterium]